MAGGQVEAAFAERVHPAELEVPPIPSAFQHSILGVWSPALDMLWIAVLCRPHPKEGRAPSSTNWRLQLTLNDDTRCCLRYTRLSSPGYTDGLWGIAAANPQRTNYGDQKTRFIFQQIMDARAARRIPARPAYPPPSPPPSPSSPAPGPDRPLCAAVCGPSHVVGTWWCMQGVVQIIHCAVRVAVAGRAAFGAVCHPVGSIRSLAATGQLGCDRRMIRSVGFSAGL